MLLAVLACVFLALEYFTELARRSFDTAVFAPFWLLLTPFAGHRFLRLDSEQTVIPAGSDRHSCLSLRHARRQVRLAVQSETLRKRRALAMTETELKLMAALASMGLRSQPNNGKKAPAAMGIPSAL
jgi:hypothetical protein